MNWLTNQVFQPRPIVVVEDHIYHISKLLAALHSAEPSVLDSITIVCLDRSGDDTDSAVSEYFEKYPTIQIAARVSDVVCAKFPPECLTQLSDTIVIHQAEYCRTIASFIRSGGMLVHDVELEFLEFVPKDRWWETTLLATTIRGIFGERKLHCVFFSNKRGYEATFGADLLAAGHDPRDVLNKNELDKIVVPKLKRFINENFSFCLMWTQIRKSAKQKSLAASCSLIERKEISTELDLILWPVKNNSAILSGMAISGKDSQISMAADSNEYQTWQSLIDDAIHGGPGIRTIEIGFRIAPDGAVNAEATNSAARHIHTLRKRLTDSRFVATVDGHYRLGDGLRIGIVE